MVGREEKKEDILRASRAVAAGALLLSCLVAASARGSEAGGPSPQTPSAATSVSASAEAEALVAEALARNPELAAARSEAAALAARAPAAGVLSDPMVSVGYENDGTSISLGTEPMTRLIFGVQQAFPFPGKLGARSRGRERRRRARGHRAGARRPRPRGRRPARTTPTSSRRARRPASSTSRSRHGGTSTRRHSRALRGRHGDAAGRPPRPERADAPPTAAPARRGGRGLGRSRCSGDSSYRARGRAGDDRRRLEPGASPACPGVRGRLGEGPRGDAGDPDAPRRGEGAARRRTLARRGPEPDFVARRPT